jgi:hypothetical protein
VYLEEQLEKKFPVLVICEHYRILVSTKVGEFLEENDYQIFKEVPALWDQ